MLFVTRTGSDERNARDCCLTVPGWEVQLQSAQRTPSMCAARLWEQMSHFFALMWVSQIKIGAVCQFALRRSPFARSALSVVLQRVEFPDAYESESTGS